VENVVALGLVEKDPCSEDQARRGKGRSCLNYRETRLIDCLTTIFILILKSHLLHFSLPSIKLMFSILLRKARKRLIFIKDLAKSPLNVDLEWA